MRFSHYNRHLYKKEASKKYFLSVLVFFFAFFNSERSGKTNHIYIGEALQVQIPKSSILLASLRDAKIEAFIVDSSEFDEIEKVATTKLVPDEKYVRPKIINLKEGIRLSKEDYILGKYKYIDENASALRISKADAKKLMENESTEALAENDLDMNQWERRVVAEEKKSFINQLGFTENHGMFNRLNSLALEELYALQEETPMKDPVVQEIEARVNEVKLGSGTQRTVSVSYNTTKTQGSVNTGNVRVNQKQNSSGASKPGLSGNGSEETGSQTLASVSSQESKKGARESVLTLSASDYMFSKKAPEKIYKTSGYEFESLDLIGSSLSKVVNDYLVKAKLRFLEGLAYLGPSSKVDVSLIYEDGREKSVEVDLEKPDFPVHISGGVMGIITRYKDAAGRLLAHNYQELSNSLKDIDLEISLKPLSWGFELLLSGIMEEETVKMFIDGRDEVNVSEGVYIDERYSRHSNFVTSLESSDGLKQIQILQAGRSNRVELLSRNYISEVEKLLKTQGQYVDPQLSYVFGRISNLKDSSGFIAQITDKNAVGPIYLNDFMIPDMALTQSSRSGMFLFVNVSADNHQIRIERNNTLVSMTAYTEAQAVTKVDFSMAEKKSLQLQVADYRSGDVLKSSYQILGLEDKYQVGAQDKVKYTYLKNKAFHQIEYWPGLEYLPHRFHFVNREEQVFSKFLPAFKKSLFEGKLDSSLPILAFYTSKGIDSLELNHSRFSFEMQTLYGLNAEGELEQIYNDSQLLSYPVVFVQGVSPGLHSIQSTSFGLITSQLFIASPGYISVIEN
ncbi:MAG: hypothetical protein VX642_13345 [Bdellovibrionota bacterium]|nr:hypothetical protein [Bdellovibrionota bacterium]